MTNVTERLAVLMRIDAEEGEKAGREWACEEVSAQELQFLSDYIDLAEFQEGFNMEHDSTAAETVFRVIHPESQKAVTQASEFWETTLGDQKHRANNLAFLCGFVVGAVMVWRTHKPASNMWP